MKRYLKIAGGAICFFSVFIVLAFYQSKAVIPAIAATPMGFDISTSDNYSIKTVVNPISNINGSAGNNSPVAISSSIGMPAVPNLPFPLPGGFPGAGGQLIMKPDTPLMKVVGLTYSQNVKKAMLKLGDDDYVTVKPGYKGNGFTVLRIEQDGVFIKVGDEVNHLKMGEE